MAPTNGAESKDESDATSSIKNQETSDSNGWPICDPRRSLHRYLIMVLLALMDVGACFCLDSAGALQERIMSDMRVSTFEYSNLYSLYNWPNVILCFCGGYLLDRVFGIRLGPIIFGVFTLVGQLIFALGAHIDKFWLMETGRFVFGIGGESIVVAQNAYIVRWFKGKELTMAFGLQLSVANLGGAATFSFTPQIYDAVSKNYDGNMRLGITLYIVATAAAFSLICMFVVAFFDWRAEKVLGKPSIQTGDVLNFRQVKEFPVAFWLILVFNVTYNASMSQIVRLGLVFFSRKYDMHEKTGFRSATTLASSLNIVVTVGAPIFGLIVDKTGHYISWILSSSLLILLCHLALSFTYLNPWVPMVFAGVSGLAGCCIPTIVAMAISEDHLGTAYGILQSVQNIGLAVVALAAGAIVDAKGYLLLEMFLIDCTCLGIITAILLWLFDTGKRGKMKVSNEKVVEEDTVLRSLEIN